MVNPNKGAQSAAAATRGSLKRGILWLTRGQLLNVAAAVHGQPTPLPARGPGRYLEVRPDDTFIVSYPRSGNTWLRFLVANLVDWPAPVDYLNIERLVPDIYVTSELSLRVMPGPRVLKSHEAFDPRYRRVIYAVRDPREVLVSQFMTLRELRSDIVDDSFERFVDRQLAGEFDAWFGSWSANVNSWVHHTSEDVELLVVRYEDLIRAPVDVAQRLAAFLGLECSPAVVAEAVENSSRGRMSDLYRSSGAQLTKAVGSANAGHLRPSRMLAHPIITPEIDASIRRRYGKTMAALGYC